MTFVVVIVLVGGVRKRIGYRSQLPTLLHHFPNLRLLHLDLRADKQRDNVIEAKRNRTDTRACHDVEQQFRHLYLQTVAVASDNLPQGICFQLLRVEPHAAFFLGGELPVLQEMEKSWDFRFQLLQEVCIVILERHNFPHPIACLANVNDDGQMLVVGTQHELCEEAYLVTVFSFRLYLVGKRGTEILQTLAVLTAVEQYLVHHDEQLACPVGIELAAEVLVGVERHVVLEYGFQEVQERTFARIPFFGHEQEDGEFLNGIEVEQLQVVHAQLVLFAEDVFHQRADAGKVALLRLVVYRLVEVEELADNGLVAHMVGYGAEAVILRDTCHVILAVVLPQGLGVPCDALSHIAAVNAGLVHNLVKRCAYSDECFFLFHVSNIGFSAADTLSAGGLNMAAKLRHDG